MSLFTEDSNKYAKVQARVQSWFNRKSFAAKRLRGLLMGVTITATLGEVCAYKLIKQDIRAGNLPVYTIEVAIAVLGTFEALVAPFISWWGFRHRRTVLISYTTLAVVCVAPWLFMPAAGERKESEFCDATNSLNSTAFLGVPPQTVARLIIIFISGIAFVLARVGCWSHGIAYSDEYAPDRTSLHYGVLMLARALPLILGYRLLTGAVDENMTMQAVGLILGLAFNLMQVFFIVPRTVPVVKGVQKTALPVEDRNFFLSLGRVFRNSLAITQMFAMGLLAAALFGYLYYELDIVKVKFNLVPEKSASVNFTELFLYHYLVVAVVFGGTLFSAPILMRFPSTVAIRQVIKMTILAIIAYATMTILINCEHGYVAGAETNYYGLPECSLSCGCKPRLHEFEPVCVLDNMVTYVSPCQAGCGASEFPNGIRVYTNCSCAASGRAAVGACSDVLCRQSHRLHSMMLFIAITFTLLAFQAQGVLLLRAVDPRDKSVVMGIAWSVIALMTYVCGHLIFLGIRVGSCKWFEDGQCHLQNELFPYLMGGTSSCMALFSLLISIASSFSIRAANRRSTDTIIEINDNLI